MTPFLQTLAELPSLLSQIRTQLEANTKVLNALSERLSNTKMNEVDAAAYLGVLPPTMYHYRLKGLAYVKVGRVISYYRKDLDAWIEAGRVRKRYA